MELASGFASPGTGPSRPPTVLWSVVALGLLAVYGLIVAMVLGMLVGALIDGLLLGESFVSSLGSASDRLDWAYGELFSEMTFALIVVFGAMAAARHALHAPRLHGFLVAAATLASDRWMADEPLDLPDWRSAVVWAAILLLATWAGGLTARWPDSSRSICSMLRRARRVHA